MWSEWFRKEYKIWILFLVFLTLLGVDEFHRNDTRQLEFLNDCTNLVLGALLGVLSERFTKKDG